MRYWCGTHIGALDDKGIFVFGSNPEGRHGLGAAKAAMKFGAVYGIGRGLQGNSYALVTKNLTPFYTEKVTGVTYPKAGKRSVTLDQIKANIAELYRVALIHDHLDFYIAYTSPGNMLNGYTTNEFIEAFNQIKPPNNIIFHRSWKGI